MTANVMDGHGFADLSEAGRPPQPVRTRSVRRGRLFGMRAGQLVVTQVAAVAVLVGAVYGTVTLAAGVALAIVLVALAWLHMRGRWAFEWLATAVRFAGRRHTAPVDVAPTGLLEFVAPGRRVEQAELAGDSAAVIVDGQGLTTVLELGDPTGLLVEEAPVLPSPASLLPPPGAEHPPCRIQLLLTGVPAPAIRAGAGTPANSYRQLTEGRLLGHGRAVLAVRVLRAEGWTEDDLRLALSGLVRKLPRRLGAVAARPLGEAAAVRVIAELAHDDGVGMAQETWPGLRVGGLAQATFRLQRWPDTRIQTSRRLISRLLALPAAATTIALSAGPSSAIPPSAARRPPGGPSTQPHSAGGPSGNPGPGGGPNPGPAGGLNPGRASAGGIQATAVDLTIRLAAPDVTALATATQALHKLLAAERAQARRLDGEHLDGLAATLPLGGAAAPEIPGRPADGVHPAEVADGLELPIMAAGLMIGSNRHGRPVVARFFRPEQTRALLVGGVRCAQLLALRAMALGARVVVQTARPQAWEPFVRGASVPGESIAVVPPGRAIEIAPGSALHPLLVVVDVGPVGADTGPGAGWQATLVVRDDFSAADVDVASRADLLLLQPLRPDEANLVGAALGLGETAQWLTRIRHDMVGLVNRRAVRWAALAQTPIEAQLIGPPLRG